MNLVVVASRGSMSYLLYRKAESAVEQLQPPLKTLPQLAIRRIHFKHSHTRYQEGTRTPLGAKRQENDSY
jgi:hypothetical protein